MVLKGTKESAPNFFLDWKIETAMPWGEGGWNFVESNSDRFLLHLNALFVSKYY
jgi:hypothetical protein